MSTSLSLLLQDCDAPAFDHAPMLAEQISIAVDSNRKSSRSKNDTEKNLDFLSTIILVLIDLIAPFVCVSNDSIMTVPNESIGAVRLLLPLCNFTLIRLGCLGLPSFGTSFARRNCTGMDLLVFIFIQSPKLGIED
mmetsp:Transcript_26552/g.58190  ORF Transcript_26552/g.58190 Transcript_26552/m.58190 type:complete len:136 (-) Transcript_26552:34-441(-)